MKIKSSFKFTAILFTVIFFSSSNRLFAQVLFQVNENDYTIWYYNGGDEFNGTEVDTSKWLGSYPWGRNLYCSFDKHYYTDFKNCKIDDGILSLIGQREELIAKAVPYENDDFKLMCDGKEVGVNLKKFDFTTGMIFSKEKYLYGFFEMRFRSKEGKGFWPAFWLYAGHENEEIDIFEINGSMNDQIHIDAHCPDGCKNYKTTLGLLRKNWGDYLSTSSNWQDGFNVVSLEWQPGYVKWFLNGVGIAYWRGEFSNAMWVIADIAISQDNRPFSPGPDTSTNFPAVFDIDYIRIWSEKKNEQIQSVQIVEPSYGTATITKRKKPEYKKKYLAYKPIFILLNDLKNNSFSVDVSEEISTDFYIEVLDQSQNELYKSSDSKTRTHQFQASKNSVLKIQVNGKFIEYQL